MYKILLFSVVSILTLGPGLTTQADADEFVADEAIAADSKDHSGKDRPHKHDSGKGDQDDGCQEGHQDHGQEKGKGKPKHCGQDVPRRVETFNVVCAYNDVNNPEGFKTCRASAVFDKEVTLDGGEVVDESPEPSPDLSSEIPFFKVECDNVSKWNDQAHSRRFTDLLSTRIQALSGPFPSIYLPRGALHVGPHVVGSYIEIDTGIPSNQQIRTNGKCHIWTGAP
ncbi:MAG: hypothetical protein AB1540_05190 [Bdellovibrionota bacterium]